jgi:hypothetical protein
VAFGIGADGRKIMLGLREGATEKGSVVSTLLQDLAGCGPDFSVRVAQARTGEGARATRAGLENR